MEFLGMEHPYAVLSTFFQKAQTFLYLKENIYLFIFDK